MSVDDDKITSLLSEGRVFEPPQEGRDAAHVGSMEAYKAAYQRSMEDPEGFWAERAEELVTWDRKWDKVLNYGRLDCVVDCDGRQSFVRVVHGLSEKSGTEQFQFFSWREVDQVAGCWGFAICHQYWGRAFGRPFRRFVPLWSFGRFRGTDLRNYAWCCLCGPVSLLHEKQDLYNPRISRIAV